MKTFNCINCGIEVAKGYTKLNKYCSNKCQFDYQSRLKLNEWLEGRYFNKKGNPPNVAKEWIKQKQNNACLHCGITEWNNKPITFQFDHIDGNSDNNTPENIRMLCPNCHSQTETYGVKNKNNANSYRNIYRRSNYTIKK